MKNMHKGYAYQISNYVAYKNNLQKYNLVSQNKTNMNKIQKKKTCKGIEPQFKKELCLIVAQVLCPNHTHTNPP